MRIFLTGGNGMLGRAFLRIAGEQFPDLEIIAPSRAELDLTNANSVREFYSDTEIDMVIHGAAKVGGITANIAEPVDFLVQNLRINDNVIMGAHNAGIEQLLFFGSSCMYPKDYRQPLVETDILAAPLEPTNEGYALSKITAGKLCEYISQDDKRDYKTVVPCNLFGTEDHFGSVASHLIAAVVTKLVDAVDDGAQTVNIWGSGQARREFLFVDDLVWFLLNNIDTITSFPAYLNLGFGTDLTVDEYYKTVAKVANYQGDFTHDTTKPEGMMQKLMDSTIASKNHGWAPRTSMLDAITQVVKAYRTQKSLTQVRS